MIPANRAPTHPGEVLLHEFLKPMNMSQSELAEKLNVSLQRVNTLINGKRDMTAETAVLLARVFNTTPEFWMNLQMACDLYEAKKLLGSQGAFEKGIYSILLAEADNKLSDVLSAILTHDGFSVHTAKNPKETLKELNNSQPDLIVFDLNASAESLKFLVEAKSAHPEVGVILLTDQKESFKIQSKWEHQFDCKVKKPVNTHVLIDSIKEVLQKHSSHSVKA